MPRKRTIAGPLAEMELGSKRELTQNQYRSWVTTACKFSKETGRKFSIKTTPEGIFIWRIA